MDIANNKSLINVLNAAVTSNHQQVKCQLHDLITKVNLVPKNDNPNIQDWVDDVVAQIHDIQYKLDDVTDWIKVMKVTSDE